MHAAQKQLRPAMAAPRRFFSKFSAGLDQIVGIAIAPIIQPAQIEFGLANASGGDLLKQFARARPVHGNAQAVVMQHAQIALRLG